MPVESSLKTLFICYMKYEYVFKTHEDIKLSK